MTLEDQQSINQEFETAHAGIHAAEDMGDYEEVRMTRAAKAQQDARDAVYQEQQAEKDTANNARFSGGAPDGEGENGPQDPGADGDSGFKPRYGYRYGIYDKGEYLSLRGLYKVDQRTGQKTIDQDKLRMALMAGIEDKGWSGGIAIYRGNRIDRQLTAQAQTMLSTDPALQLFMQRRGISGIACQKGLDPERPPSWLKTDKGLAGHQRRCEQEARENMRAEMRELKAAEKKLARGFHADEKSGETMRETLRARRQEIKESLPPNMAQRAFASVSGLLGGTAIGSSGIPGNAPGADAAAVSPGQDAPSAPPPA